MAFGTWLAPLFGSQVQLHEFVQNRGPAALVPTGTFPVGQAFMVDIDAHAVVGGREHDRYQRKAMIGSRRYPGKNQPARPLDHDIAADE